jgi:uncharacterized membrane protein
MGKFSGFERVARKKEAPWKVHPVWQGIGCILIVLIPLMSYAGAVLLVKANIEHYWVVFPREFYGPPGHPLLYSQLGVTVLLSVFGFMILVTLYTILYRFLGPPRYGPTDAPPPKRTISRRTRLK